MTVSVSNDLDQFVREQVSLGRYSKADAVVEEALKLLKAQQLRQSVHDSIADYANEYAGSEFDLDESLESAGLESISETL